MNKDSEPNYSPAQRARVGEPGVGKGHYTRKEKGTYPSGMQYQIAKRRGLKGNPRVTQGHKNQPPTAKQKAAVEAYLANPGGTHKENAEKAGYAIAPSGSNTPQVIGSRGFQEYLDEKVPDEKLAALINEGLSAEKAPSGYEDFVPDWANRFKFVELVTRLKGYGKTDTPVVNVTFTNSIPRPKSEPIDGEVVE